MCNFYGIMCFSRELGYHKQLIVELNIEKHGGLRVFFVRQLAIVVMVLVMMVIMMIMIMVMMVMMVTMVMMVMISV